MLKKENPVLKEILKNIGLVTQLGLAVVSSILIFVLGSLYLEKKLNTDGKLLIAGVLLGVAAGILAAYRILKKTFKD